jgi:hypothetical protein
LKGLTGNSSGLWLTWTVLSFSELHKMTFFSNLIGWLCESWLEKENINYGIMDVDSSITTYIILLVAHGDVASLSLFRNLID